MYISKFSLKNYKSFNTEVYIELTQGINVITGQNNSGKTALLEALSLKANGPHRSTKTIPKGLSQELQGTEITVDLKSTKEELRNFFLSSVKPIYMPILDEYLTEEHFRKKDFLDIYFEGSIDISVIIVGGGIKTSKFKINRTVRKNEVYQFNTILSEKNIHYFGIVGSNSDSSAQYVNNFINQIYLFKAERLKVGVSHFGSNPILNTDASNLPEVLNILQGDPMRFKRFNEQLRKVLPQIFQVTVRPLSPNNQLEIVVWNEDPILERSDLVVPLLQCGTGVSQVLSLLYVILTADAPKTIIIDEPNSFLHPGAAKKLIEILKEHPQHQFIISTHSPSTIAAANPQTIHVVKIKSAESTVESINLKETENQRLFLAEVGAKLSDVFGADNILWVEGKTEEICFPRIVEKMQGVFLMGTTILSVINTGDFQAKRNARLIFDVYEKLSKGKGLLPPALKFIFDREDLSIKELKDLDRRSGGQVVFLQRRMFENYLLNPDAILHVIKSELPDLEVTKEEIIRWIEKNRWRKDLISENDYSEKTDKVWIERVNGAKLLDKLFSEVTAQKLKFDKIKHSVWTCNWIIDNSFEDLFEIEILLGRTLNKDLVS